uniref:Magnetosome protein MamS/MamX domain-containing protein n=1 Tax=Desulfobacca acetoxidans TaxID=60893 RepID=A0A7V4G862_9BACT
MKRWQGFGMMLLCLAGVWGILSEAVLAQGRGQGFRPCPYTPYSCPVSAVCRPFDEKGKVARVFTETLAEDMHPGMALVLDTKNRGQVQVSLGPVWYLERQEFELKAGDEVQVKGMCEDTKDGKLRVIAYEITVGDHVLALRDPQGRPNWEAWRKK